jgi:flavin-dependent dehydrogenase
VEPVINTDVIIVGGGPAGSTCAWKLRELDIECMVLDKADFPRGKLCAGWITPRVVRLLKLDDYPGSVTPFKRFLISYRGRKVTLRTRQYAVERARFDHWLLKRAGVPVHRHTVRHIVRDREGYVVDNRFRCRFLVGAGGTYCPVYRTVFKQVNPRAAQDCIVAMEDEFECDYSDSECYLWFCENGLPGYAWYVPKSGGVVNVGTGGLLAGLKRRGSTILQQWDYLVNKTSELGLVAGHDFRRQGYCYYRRGRKGQVWRDNACIIGDAAGLATRDMGEGIGQAVESAVLAAQAVSQNSPPSFSSIPRYSLPGMIMAGIIPGRSTTPPS